MAESAIWKQVGDVLKTEGNILEVGEFTDVKNRKFKITPELAKTLYNNIDSSLPFVILHEDGYQEPVGYATSVGETDLI